MLRFAPLPACSATRRLAFHCPLQPLAALLAAALSGAGGSALAQTGGPAAQSLPPVVITASRHLQWASDAPASISVVTRRDIEARGADTVLEALRGEVGVSLSDRAIGGRRVLSLRGMDSKHTLFLIDGQRLGASDGTVGHSDFQYDWVPVEAIERIEIVRGPMSVLYGAEALGGVVQIITRRASARWSGAASLEASSADGGRGGSGYRLGAQASGPLAEGLRLSVGAAHRQLDPVAATSDPRIDELESRTKDDGWATLDWRVQAGHALQASWREGRESRWAHARERSGKRRYHETTNAIERRHASFGWTADWTPAFNTQLRAYAATLDVRNERTQGVAVNTPQRLGDRVLEGQVGYAAAAAQWTGGLELRNEALDDPGLPGGRSLARHRSVYLQNEWTASPAMAVTLGLRHDRHSLYGAQWSPRLYAVWQWAEGWTLKGGSSHGFKAPNLKQIVPGARAEGPNLFHGNPDLVPERSDNVEVSLGHVAGRSQGQLTLFDQRVHDLIDIVPLAAGPTPGTGSYTYRNLSRARLRGVEAAWVQPLGANWTLRTAYTGLDARSGDGRRLDKRPRHQLSLALDFQHGPWRAGLSAERTHDLMLPSLVTGQPSQRVSGYSMVGAHASAQVTAALELAVGVSNLTQTRLADLSPLYAQIEPPRAWRASLRGRW